MTAQVMAVEARDGGRLRTALAARLPGLAGVLTVPGIVGLCVSNALAQGFGQRMQGVIVAWLVLEMTDSKAVLGLVNGLPALPVLLFSLLGGVIADSYNAKRVMVLSRGALALTAFATAALVGMGQISAAHLLLYVLIVVGITAIDMPVSRTFVYGVVGGPRLLSTNAMQSVIMNAITIIVPVMAGLMLGFGGPEAAFALLGSGYVIAAALILRGSAQGGAPASAGSNPLADVVAGIAYIRSTPAVAALVGLAFLVPVAGIYFAMVPVFAREVLHVGAGGLGVLVASFSAGGLVGSVWLAAGRNLTDRGRKLTVLGVAFGIGMMAFALSQSFLLSCGISFLLGVLAAFWQNILGVLLQVVAAPEMRGRVTSVFTMGFQLVGLGWLLGGFTASLAGVEVTVLVGGAVFSGLSLAIFLLSPDVRRMD